MLIYALYHQLMIFKFPDFCLKIQGRRKWGRGGVHDNFSNVKIYKALIPIGPKLSLSYILRHFELKFHKRGFFVKNNDFYISDLVFHNFRFLKCHFIFQIFGVSQFWGFKDPQILRN